jgi:hypothetical protein
MIATGSGCCLRSLGSSSCGFGGDYPRSGAALKTFAPSINFLYLKAVVMKKNRKKYAQHKVINPQAHRSIKFFQFAKNNLIPRIYCFQGGLINP